MPGYPDRELVQRVKDGDRQAYDQLVTTYQQRIYSLALHMVRNHHDAADLSQEVFLKAYQSIGQFQGNSSFYTWIYKITVNLCINHIKKRSLKSLIPFESVSRRTRSRTPGPDSGLERDELSQAIDEAVAQLPPKQRAVFVLRQFDEQPYSEIAQIMGRSEGGVKANYFHAVRKVRNFLKERLTEDDMP